MPEIDVSWMLEIVETAGKLALSHFGKTKGTLKPDESWVTQADLDVEKYLRSQISRVRPDDAILGEEGENPQPESPIVWAIDPVDGTRAFNLGFPIWGVSVGVLKLGVPTLGAFILPAIGDIYHTDGKTSFHNGVRLEPPRTQISSNAVLMVSEGAHSQLSINYGGKIFSLGSAAAHLCYVARGSAIGAFDQASIWDYAASAAILQVLGVPFRYLSGEAVDFSALYSGLPVAEPTLVCPIENFDTIRDATTYHNEN
jgi:myo-inositol-1(or 4)-monophosphatase